MAAEMFCGAIVSTLVQKAIDSLASCFMDSIRGKKLNKELLSKLTSKLPCIDVLADDAEQKQFRDSRVRDWLLKAKHVVFDAEDLLAEIDVELSKCQVEAESNTIVGRVTASFLQTFTVDTSTVEPKRMEQILKDIEDLLNQSIYLGLKKDSGAGVGSGSGSNESGKFSSTSLPSASVIYGRDDEKEKIIKWLITSHTGNKLSILSIVGMGGLGKTTLAQLVYNDSKIEGEFDIKAWVCVSDDFDVLKVTRTILERITGSTDDSRDLETVQTKLKENLSGKKFLLVLDDVWNEEWHKWEEVQKPLVAFGAQGIKILVTTRSKDVASTMRSEEHNLKDLQQDHCWQLFAEHASPDDILQPIGMQIVKKCKGLPLALKSMGSLLHNKSSVSEWQSVLESEIWQLKDNTIVPALALSYLHLPYHLKKCFAYCALFPKGYEFDKEDVTQLWMGEKFLLRNEHGTSPENVEQIFNDLLSRSFFQQSSSFRGGFVMHDLLNDLAKFVCGDICFRLGVDQIKGIPKATRHFSFSGDNFDGFGSLPDVERLHTFMPTYPPFDDRRHFQMRIEELLPKFKFIRVLSLKSCGNLEEVPQSVGDLKHLCSLDLSNTRIYKLPESLCSLFNMQILKLNDCRNLTELPSNLNRLTKLYRLEFKETEIRKVSPQLGKLKNLRVCMSSFVVGESSEFTPQQLGELNVHGSLSIQNLQNIENPLDALSMHLKNKTHLEELALKWGYDRQPMNRNLDDSLKEREVEIVIENMKPSEQLKKLSITNYGGTKFPSWLLDNSLRNVVSLMLDSCQSCQSLPSLGHLPFLKELFIRNLDGIVSIDADFYGSYPFSFTSLETLKFSDMDKWERWECEGVTGAFPRLKHLSLWDCPKLKGDLPVKDIDLEELEISCCEQLETCAPKTSKLELEDNGKLQFDWTDLKCLKMKGHKMEASLVQMFGHNRPVTSLEELVICCCPNLFSDPCNCQISDDGYDSLKTFPLDFFPTLNTLRLTSFPDLQMISLERANNHLKFLRIENCPELESLPKGMDILQKLEIRDCPKVEWVPGGYLSSNLKRMTLRNCSKLVISQKGAFGANPSLEYLFVSELDAENFPDQGLLPLSLTSLGISNCESLKKLEYKGLCHLSSLRELYIRNCPKLECLPEEGLPKSISHLSIADCPLVKQRC